jgi:hypothetical protein
MLVRVVILQDAENYQFLYPTPDGDVGYTPLLSKAGMFESEQEAIDTAEFVGCENYSLMSFFTDLQTKLTHRQ